MMDYEEFKQKLQEESNKIRIKIGEKESRTFYDFMKILLEENEKVNLTAITEENEIIIKHFIETVG